MAQTLGQRLRALRHERHLTLQDVAKAAVLSVGYVNDMEHDRTNPSLKTLVRLATAYDITALSILQGVAPYDR